MRLAALLPFLMLTVACEASSLPDPLTERSCQMEKVLPVGENRSLDLVFVVDESPAMAPYQASLATNLHFMAQVLANIQGGLPDIHIAVVSADPAHAGVFRVPTGCGLHDGNFISDVQNGSGDARVRNYAGELADVLTCLGTPGASGSATAAPLASLRAALDGSHGENAGFLREQALLGVVILSAQDDCSGTGGLADPLACAAQGVRCDGAAPATPGTYSGCVAASGKDVGPIGDTVAFLRGLKDDPSLIGVSVASAPPEPFVVGAGPGLASSCTNGTSGALPAVRLHDFAAQFPVGDEVTLCGGDWSNTLRWIAEASAIPLSLPCLDPFNTHDLAPDRPGLQPECNVTQIRFPETDMQTERVLPRCTMLDELTVDPASERPCWWVKLDPICQQVSDFSGFLLEVERAPDTHAPPGSYLVIRCASCE